MCLVNTTREIMTIKYFKYTKSTLPAIQAGMIEVYGGSDQHVSKELLQSCEGLKIGIGFIPKWEISWNSEQRLFGHCGGIYVPTTKTIWVLTQKDVQKIVNHELLHAIQFASTEAKNLIWELAKSSPKWEEAVQLVNKLYPQNREIEYPVWVLQHEQATVNSLVKKYLR